MLLCSRQHLQPPKGETLISAVKSDDLGSFSKGTAVSHFLPTSKRIVQFSEGREPKEGDRVVYVNGAFDLFRKLIFKSRLHLFLTFSEIDPPSFSFFLADIGHIEFLKRAKEQGDYLLVGVLDDQVVNHIKGSNFPIMNLHERVLGVLSCRVRISLPFLSFSSFFFFIFTHFHSFSPPYFGLQYVDEVIIGAPFSVTKDVLEKVYKIHLVVHGATDVDNDENAVDPYEVAFLSSSLSFGSMAYLSIQFLTAPKEARNLQED